MAGNLNLTPDLANNAVAADQEGRPFDPHIFTAVEGFLFPDAVFFEDGPIFVRGEHDFQAVLPPEFFVFVERILRNADNHGAGAFEGVDIVRKINGLSRTARRVVFRVEIKDQLLSSEGFKRNLSSVVRGEGKSGRFSPFGECFRHFGECFRHDVSDDAYAPE